MNIVPITAKTKVEILEITGALSGIAIRTAKRTKNHNVLKIMGLLLFGIPLPSR